MTTHFDQAAAQFLSTFDSVEILERRLLMAFFEHPDVLRVDITDLNGVGETIPMDILRASMRTEGYFVSDSSGAMQLFDGWRSAYRLTLMLQDMRSLFSPVATGGN